MRGKDPTLEPSTDPAVEYQVSLVDSVAKETQQAIDRVLDERFNGPRALAEPLYTEYHPRDGGPTRMLKIIDIKNDPLEPPRHKLVSAPQVEQELSVPVLREDVLVTAKDVQAWKLPRVQSSWKNPGYKMARFEDRVANDFRSRQRTPQIGPNAGRLAKALNEAEDEVRAIQELEELEKAQQLQQASQVTDAYLQRKAQGARRGRNTERRERRSQSRSKSPAQYDSRLYTKARPATTGPYDGPLFAAQAVSEMYTPKGQAGVEFEKD